MREKGKKKYAGFKGRVERPDNITYDENDRRDFITGFHKRKMERKKIAIAKSKQELLQEKREARKEKMLKLKTVQDQVDKIDAIAQGNLSKQQNEEKSLEKLQEEYSKTTTLSNDTAITTVTVTEDFLDYQ